MSTLRIHLFGKFNVQRDSRVLKGLTAHKVQELISYLLVRRDQSHPRESLASVLWAETSSEKSKKYLRQALWHLQAALEEKGSTSPQLLVVEHDWVYLNLHSDLWLDVEILERAYASTHDTPGARLDKSSAELLKNAVEVYKGDLLDGWYEDWCLFERERLQNMYLLILEKLMVFSKTHGDFEAGQSYGSTILRFDPARESTHRQLMQVYYMAGNRTAALRQYERCVRALAEELEVEPQKSTIALCEQIRADRLDTTTAGEPLIHVSALQEALDHLKRFQAVLSTVQGWLQRDIKAVEQDVQSGTSHGLRSSSREN
jgi:DNA-binding SARP family transcriptional activator